MPSSANVLRLHEQGRASPSTPRAQQSTQGASWLRARPRFEAVPPFRNNWTKKTWRQTAACPSHSARQEMANHNSMHLGQACRKTKTNKLKSTSEVTLQDSNLEVYWQRGKRPGLVHGRDTLTEHPPAGTGATLGQTGGEHHQETITHPCRCI